MSFIRWAHEGTYVPIPRGSDMYIYGNGHNINGWSYGEFAGMLYATAWESTDHEWTLRDIRKGLITWSYQMYYGIAYQGEDDDRPSYGEHLYEFEGAFRNHSPTSPEWGEMLCQVLDKRTKQTCLTSDFHREVRRTCKAEFGECRYCGEKIRTDNRIGEPPYVCSDEECSDKLWDEAKEVLGQDA